MDDARWIPAGYKRTEVGVIPEDWEVQKVGEISEVGRGRVISHREIKASLNSLYPVYSSQTSNAGIMGYIDTYDFEGEYITWTTDGVNAGTVFYRNGRFNCTNVCGTIKLRKHEAFFVSRALGAIAPQYVSRNLANPKLMNDVMKQVPVPLPSLPEQRAIADVLSDVDALIAALDHLIAKKRAIQQGAMQQLLTGQTRLPGFSEPWEVKQLGEMGEFQSGNGFPTQYQGDLVGDYPFFKVSDMNKTGNETVMRSANNWITEDVRKIIGAKTLPQHSIVFAKIGAAIFLERKKLLLQESCIDNNMMGFIPDKSTSDYGFVQYLFLNIQLGKLVSTTALPYLSGKEIAELEYPFPELEEQRAIAGVLSDMDAEIAALEARRDKTRAIKQGMMQELLTGKTRLV